MHNRYYLNCISHHHTTIASKTPLYDGLSSSRTISNNSSFRQEHPGVPDGDDGSD
jgi:hypothetical protein